MMRKKHFFVLGALLLGLASAPPGHAQSRCTASQQAAVECFVRNAVTTGLASVPAGMSMAQFKAYGVSVSDIVRTPDAVVFFLGTMAAVADAMPARKADGTTPDQPAQETAVSALVEAGLRAGLILLPAQVTPEQVKLFSRDVVRSFSQYAGVSLSPGTPLRFLDSILLAATSSTGIVDWTAVRTQLSNFIDGLTAAGILKIPPSQSADGVKQFAYDVTRAIYDYKLATGRTRL